MNFKDKEELKNLANIELQLSLSSDPDSCNIASVDEYNEWINKKQIKKSNIMFYRQHSFYITVITFILSFLGFLNPLIFLLIFLSPIFGIVSLIYHIMYRKVISKIKSALFHLAYVDVIYKTWLDEIEKSGVIKTCIAEKDILNKRNIYNPFYLK